MDFITNISPAHSATKTVSFCNPVLDQHLWLGINPMHSLRSLSIGVQALSDGITIFISLPRMLFKVVPYEARDYTGFCSRNALRIKVRM